MLAYFSPGTRCSGPASEMPEFARVLAAGPWSACRSMQDGKPGALIWSQGFNQPIPNFAPERWRPCSDGLLYLRPDPIPDQMSLARARRANSFDLTTSRGITLSIPLAASAPRLVSFSAGTLGDPADDFGGAAFAVFDRLAEMRKDPAKVVTGTDPEVLRLVLLALQQTYRVTAELLDDLRWISSADIEPIILAIMGQSPKALEAAGAQSPSPAAA